MVEGEEKRVCPECGPVGWVTWNLCADCGVVPKWDELPLAAQVGAAPLPDVVPDPISAPSHYTTHPSGVEALQITSHHSFNVGNAIKYLWRMGLKEGETELKDLSKALFYIYAEARKKGARIPDFAKIDELLGK